MSLKKNKLRGAIQNELKANQLMQDFISNIQEDKEEPSNSKNQNAQTEKNRSNETFQKQSPIQQSFKQSKEKFKKSQSPKSDGSNKEWWISFSSLIFVILIITGIFYLFSTTGPNSFITLANNPIPENSIEIHENPPELNLNRPVFFVFRSKNPINSSVLTIHIFKVQDGTRSVVTSFQVNIKKHWNSVETYFQKEFFDTPGAFELVIENQERIKICSQKFKMFQ